MRFEPGPEFILVTGKGGSGRSTVSTALALTLARRKRRVLLAMCNSKEPVSRLLGVAPIGHNNREVLPGLDAVNMTPRAALEEYGTLVLRNRAFVRLVLDNRWISGLLNATPGMEAWSMLGKAYYHALEQDKKGVKRYDHVIVDAPATGHTLDMLRVPYVINKLAPVGVLRRDAERAVELFQDPRRAAAIITTLAEELSVNEALELNAKLRSEFGISVGLTVVNRVWPPILSASDLLELRVAQTQAESPPWVNTAALGVHFANRVRSQQSQVQRLAEFNACTLPELFRATLGRSELAQLQVALESLCVAF